MDKSPPYSGPVRCLQSSWLQFLPYECHRWAFIPAKGVNSQLPYYKSLAGNTSEALSISPRL